MKYYQWYLLKIFMRYCLINNFENKIVLEIGSDFELNVAKKLVELGAKKVFCVNPLFPKDLVSPDERIILITNYVEKTNFKSHFFDYIIGIAILEHVVRIEKSFKEIKRMLKFNGYAFLEGCPMYTCSHGHHIMIDTGEIFYKFLDNTNPFESWEHLLLQDKDDYIKCLKSKNIPENHIEKIYEMLLSDVVSKIVPSKIISIAKKIFGSKLVVETLQESEPHNFYYEQAKSLYKEEDLNTKRLILYIGPKYLKYLIRIKNKLLKLKTKKFRVIP